MFLTTLVAVATISQVPQDAFPDNGKNHWAYEGISYLKSQGLLASYPDRLGMRIEGSTENRFSMASKYLAAAAQMKRLESLYIRYRDEIAGEKPVSEEDEAGLKRLKQSFELIHRPLYSNALNYLNRAGKEFAPELKSMGVSTADIPDAVAEMRAEIRNHPQIPVPGTAFRQFSDVPPNHWAAKATLELRSLGLLHGYPDGSFKG